MSSSFPSPWATEPANLLTEWSRLLLGSFARLGVRDVIVSPGSRSTPFVWAALQTPEFTCHSVLDERAAGFFALGLARATDRPALLLCTSGTAAAHYFPALIEAAESHVPLLVVTADRPSELRHAAAPQTIDQTRLFGDFVRGFFDLGTPSAHESAFRSVSRFATQAYERSLAGAPGPVHLNAPARKPLEPRAAETEGEHALVAWVDAKLDATARVFPPVVGASSGVDELTRRLARSRRPLFVAGPLRPADGRAVAATARHFGVPLLAECASQAPGAEPLDLMLRSVTELEAPDLIVQFGTPCTSSRYPAVVERWAAPTIALASAGYPDPSQRLEALLLGDIAVTLTACRAALEALPRSFEFDRLHLSRWRAHGVRTRDAARISLDSVRVGRNLGLPEPHAVLTALGCVPEDGQILLGNSLPLRLADAAMASWPSSDADGPRVFVQRGVNGIDGLLASSAGLATAMRAPTLAILGDVTTAHDLSSLALARRVTSPFCLLVVDNAGGHIFDQLPLAQRRGDSESALPGLDAAWEFWSTPPELDFVAIARGYGARGVEVDGLESLRVEVTRALATGGFTLVRTRTHAASTPHFFREFDAAFAALGVEP